MSEVKQLNKRIAEQDMTIERQRIVIKAQYETLQFVLANKPLWKLILT